MKKILFIIFLSLFFATPVAAEQKYPAGTLIKSATNPAVYYIGDDGKRHAFPNAKVYNSWYKDFSQVQVVTEFDLADVQLGKNVLYRSGSRLIKTPSVNEVYAVGPWGELRNIASEQVALALYGADWAKLVDDIDISFFFDYHIVGVIDIEGENIIYPRGSLIRNDGLTWVIDTRSGGEQIARPISGQAWIDNNFDGLLTYNYTGFVTDQYEVGIPVYGEEARFTCPYCQRANFDNKTIFEQYFFNTKIEVKDYTVSGQMPENWQQVTGNLDTVTFKGAGEAKLIVKVEEKADGYNTLQHVLESRHPGHNFMPESKYLDIDLVRSDELIQFSQDSSGTIFVITREKETHFEIFQFSVVDSEMNDIWLEKHWDEIELILDNISINKIVEEVPDEVIEDEELTTE